MRYNDIFLGNFFRTEKRQQLCGGNGLRLGQLTCKIGQKADNRLRAAVVLPEGGNFQIAVAFGKPASCSIRKQRNVAEGRWRQVQQAVKIKLYRCGAEQIAATHYLIYAHERIVDDNSQLVGVDAVTAAQDEVTTFVRQVGLLPAIVYIRKGASAACSSLRLQKQG